MKGLTVFTAMLRTITFRKDVMAQAASGGFTNATDCADYLVRKGSPSGTHTRSWGSWLHTV